MHTISRTALVGRPLAHCRGCFGTHSRVLPPATTLRRNIQLPPRPKVSETDIEEKFLKGSGPGGQKINKTSSAVQLRHSPTGIVVKSQATRSRSQNRKIARQLLADKLDERDKGEDSRAKLKEKAKIKKTASATKKSRRKYRALEEEKRLAAERSGEEAQSDEGCIGDGAVAEQASGATQKEDVTSRPSEGQG